jgi:hypothetical protein
VCNNTLTSRKIDPNRVAMEAKIVPSGVAEVARLQAREGFVDGNMFLGLTGSQIGQGQSWGRIIRQGTVSSATVNVTNRRGSV